MIEKNDTTSISTCRLQRWIFVNTPASKFCTVTAQKKWDVHIRRTSENYRSVINDFYSEKIKIVAEEDNDRWIYKMIKKNHSSILQSTFSRMNMDEEKVIQHKKAELGFQKYL